MPEISFREVETQPQPSISIIWLHGLGADGSDFVPLVPELGLDNAPGVRFIFPDAPFRSVTCNGGYEMRAWYDIISLAPENREIDEQGLVESVGIVRQLIARENERGIPSDRVFIAGFSQGGAVAYSAALTHPEPLAGVIALSTYIPSARLVTKHASMANRAIRIFTAHGEADDVVSMTLGETAVGLIRGLGYQAEWHTYPMGHEVSFEEINDIAAWLKATIDKLVLPSEAACAKAVLQSYGLVTPYVTKDGSEIRELMHPNVHGNAAQSLAEATVLPGTQTELHRHGKTEEIYHITAGVGRMTLGDQQFLVEPGDTVLISPGTPHCIAALGDIPLKLLCCCAPAYDHEDTELLAHSKAD